MRSAEIRLLLPEVLQRCCIPESPLDALIGVMEAMHAPSEAVLTDLGSVVDPHRTPDRFVGMLADWLDLGGLGRIETGRMRQLVAAAAELNRRRGTAAGLRQLLVIATGLTDIAVQSPGSDASGAPLPFHVNVLLPTTASQESLALVTAIVQREKPAHVTADVLIQQDLVAAGDPAAGADPAARAVMAAAHDSAAVADPAARAVMAAVRDPAAEDSVRLPAVGTP